MRYLSSRCATRKRARGEQGHVSQNPQVAELRILKSVSASASVLRVTGSVRRRRCMHCGRARSVDQVRAQLVEQPILHRHKSQLSQLATASERPGLPCAGLAIRRSRRAEVGAERWIWFACCGRGFSRPKGNRQVSLRRKGWPASGHQFRMAPRPVVPE